MAYELRLLHCALALAEHGTFARAAEVVHVSQPALSRSIQEIERRAGTQLFERGTGGVVPTDAGNIFLGHAREVVARAADLNREMDLLRGLEKGELSIGAGTYPSAMMVERAVVRLLQSHPTIRLQIHTDNREKLLPLLRKRELDLAVIGVTGMEVDSEVHITALNQHQGYFVVRNGHPLLASNEAPTLHSILQFPTVMTSRVSAPVLKQFLAGESANGTHHPPTKSFPAIACESVAMMKMITAETDAVGVLPLNAVMAEVRAGHLVVLSLVPPFMKVDFGVVRLAHRSLSLIGETFVRILMEVDAELLEFERSTAAKLFATPKHGRPMAGSISARNTPLKLSDAPR
jgi:DNA-binding transcriptional LysR family regulator